MACCLTVLLCSCAASISVHSLQRQRLTCYINTHSVAIVLHHTIPYYLPYFIKWYTHHKTYCCKVHTVDQKIFAVKIFCQLLRWWKLNAQNFSMVNQSTCTHHTAKINAWTHVKRKKKLRENFPIYGMFVPPQEGSKHLTFSACVLYLELYICSDHACIHRPALSSEYTIDNSWVWYHYRSMALLEKAMVLV